MCAERIQAVFRGYIARKRYNIAFRKLKKFVGFMDAAVKGWKVRNIMRCLKIK
jgi:hypothetical protein